MRHSSTEGWVRPDTRQFTYAEIVSRLQVSTNADDGCHRPAAQRKTARHTACWVPLSEVQDVQPAPSCMALVSKGLSWRLSSPLRRMIDSSWCQKTRCSICRHANPSAKLDAAIDTLAQQHIHETTRSWANNVESPYCSGLLNCSHRSFLKLMTLFEKSMLPSAPCYSRNF